MVFLLVGWVGACGGDPPPSAADSPVPVVIREVAAVNRPETVDLSGEAQGLRTAQVGFQLPGVVTSVHFREGDVVRQGDVLAELDARELRLHADVATAQRERAEDELTRLELMYREGGLPESDYRGAETAARIARAQEGLALKKVEDARLLAPMGGVVARRGIEPGEQAGPGVPVFTLVQVDPLWVTVGVPEAEIGRISRGQSLIVTVPALDNATFNGRVVVVGVAADPVSRAYTVKGEVANPDRRLRPGMIVEARIETGQEVSAITVPPDAVVPDIDGVTRVWVFDPDEGRVYSRRVTVGPPLGQEVEIQSGLSEGERILIAGQHRVREGSRVAPSGDAP